MMGLKFFSSKNSLAEQDRFIDLLLAACTDTAMRNNLQSILTLPDARRIELVGLLVADMQRQGAPKAFIEAISCLSDTAIAEKAYEVLFSCQR